MKFIKMQGLGNDFVLVDSDVDVTADLVRALCDRHFGVGADGVLSVGVHNGRVAMGYWNADGSSAEMCGNGLRCVARVAVDRGLAQAGEFEVDTPAGPRRVRVDRDIRVDLGVPVLGDMVEIGGRFFRNVSVGNPHAVLETDDVAGVAVAEIGRDIQQHYPSGVNVEFVRIQGDSVEMRVWERGVGETLACGSGIVAAAAVARRNGGGDVIEVSMPGGTAQVVFEDGGAWLVGPAAYVFEGVGGGEWPSGGPTA
jgi:diaminopimelate epimerase